MAWDSFVANCRDQTTIKHAQTEVAALITTCWTQILFYVPDGFMLTAFTLLGTLPWLVRLQDRLMSE